MTDPRLGWGYTPAMVRARERSSPSSGRGCLLAVLFIAAFIFCGAGSVILVLFATGTTGPPEIVQEVGRVSGTNPPILAVGWSGNEWLAGWRSDRGAVIYGLETGQSTTIAGLPFVTQIVTSPGGVLAFGGERVAILATDGRSVSEVRTLPSLPPATERVLAVNDSRLLIAGSESGQPSGTISVAMYQADGALATSVLTIPAGSRFPGRPGIAALGPALTLVAWLGSAERDGVSLAVVDGNGTIIRLAPVVYQAGRGGAVQCCWAAPKSGGGAFVIWQDSSPGSWEIFSLTVGPTGDPEQPVQISAGDGRDDIQPRVSTAGDRSVAAWLTGIHFGIFTWGGSGSIAIRPANGIRPARTLRAESSIETYAIGVNDRETALVASTRERDGYRIVATTVR